MGSNSSFLFLMVIMMVVWYFLLIRPQQQRVKRHKEMLKNLHKGDRVLTQGGLMAKVTSVSPDSQEVEIEIASGVKVKVLKSSIQENLNNINLAPSQAANASKTKEPANSTKSPAKSAAKSSTKTPTKTAAKSTPKKNK